MTIDDLEAYGLERMTDDEIRSFMASQGLGVLGLPGDETPYMLPMSFGFDGDERLYFTYLIGSGSQKAALTDQTTSASFLIYSVETMYNWESVRLQGTLSEVPEAEWGELEDALQTAWRPDLLETATAEGTITIFEFHIDDQTGIKHTGLPPAFE